MKFEIKPETLSPMNSVCWIWSDLELFAGSGSAIQILDPERIWIHNSNFGLGSGKDPE